MENRFAHSLPLTTTHWNCPHFCEMRSVELRSDKMRWVIRTFLKSTNSRSQQQQQQPVLLLFIRSRDVKHSCRALMKFSRRWRTTCHRNDFASSRMLYAKNNCRLSRTLLIHTKYFIIYIFFSYYYFILYLVLLSFVLLFKFFILFFFAFTL